MIALRISRSASLIVVVQFFLIGISTCFSGDGELSFTLTEVDPVATVAVPMIVIVAGVVVESVQIARAYVAPGACVMA
jgi:hypothetical protein